MTSPFELPARAYAAFDFPMCSLPIETAVLWLCVEPMQLWASEKLLQVVESRNCEGLNWWRNASRGRDDEIELLECVRFSKELASAAATERLS